LVYICKVLSPTSASSAKERLLNWVRSQISTSEYHVQITNFDSWYIYFLYFMRSKHSFIFFIKNWFFLYPFVYICDTTLNSWQDGMAFCALVHKFVPTAFDFHSLDKVDELFSCVIEWHIASTYTSPIE
jgi:hypothetical protein